MKKLVYLFLIFLFFPIFKISEDKKDETIRMMFFWDTNFATRGFEYFVKKDKKTVKDYFAFFYDENWKSYLRNLDFVSVNFETWLFWDKNPCPVSWKSIIIKTHEKYLPEFKKAWINLMDISNNHSYDCGWENFDFMKKSIKSAWINPFWDWRWNEKNLYKTEIKWQKIAFLWFNETTFFNDWDKKVEEIKTLKNDWYLVILNIHWWDEYKTKNNKTQRDLAEKFVWAWVSAIIWHHPHVVENYEIIEWIPVFYSLWNFMFDQPFEETLPWIWVYLEIKNQKITYKVIDFKREVPFYEIKKLDFDL